MGCVEYVVSSTLHHTELRSVSSSVVNQVNPSVASLGTCAPFSTENIQLPSTTARSRPASKPVLEMGAGTGICGMVACRALGCPVILTDRRGDVIDNLNRNVALNGMEHSSVCVVRLEWGGHPDDGTGVPCEVKEHSPFQARFLLFIQV